MVKYIRWFLILCPLLVACNQKKIITPEEQQKVLDDMYVKASIIYDEWQNKTGKEYLSLRDKYYTLKYQWIKTAIKYAAKFNPENKTEDEIRRMAYIAEIAKNEAQVADILKEDFKRFPESKSIEDLVLKYFNNAFLLEPSVIKEYVDFTLFKQSDELYCYAMLALGFSEQDNIQQAKIYYEKMNTLLAKLLADPVENNTIPELYIVGLRSFIACRMGNKEEAYTILTKAAAKFSKEIEQILISLFRKRVNLFGSSAPDLGTQHWIGIKTPIELSALKGKVVLLNFFTWDCEECSLDIPFLKRLQEQINSNAFRIIGATKYVGAYEHEQGLSEKAEYEFMKNHYYNMRKIQWPISMSKISMDNYGIYAAPTYVLIDKTGIVRDGYFVSNFTYLKNKITSLLNE